MAADPITAVANAVTALTGIAAPLISESEAQANENLRIELVDDWTAALAVGNLDGMHAQLDRMLKLAGAGVGVEQRRIVVDVAYLDQLARVCAAYIAQDRQLNSLLSALQKPAK